MDESQTHCQTNLPPRDCVVRCCYCCCCCCCGGGGGGGGGDGGYGDSGGQRT